MKRKGNKLDDHNEGNKSPKRFKMSKHRYYQYHNEDVKCECGWYGKGSDAALGDLTDYWIYLDCPKCPKENIAAIALPTFEEVEKYGSEKDKESVKRRQEFIKNLDEKKIRTPEQLPDIKGDDKIVLSWDFIINNNILIGIIRIRDIFLR